MHQPEPLLLCGWPVFGSWHWLFRSHTNSSGAHGEKAACVCSFVILALPPVACERFVCLKWFNRWFKTVNSACSESQLWKLLSWTTSVRLSERTAVSERVCVCWKVVLPAHHMYCCHRNERHRSHSKNDSFPQSMNHKLQGAQMHSGVRRKEKSFSYILKFLK